MIRLICFLLLGLAGTGLMIHAERELGIFRIPLVMVIGISYFLFFKTLIIKSRSSGTVLTREQQFVRVFLYVVTALGVLAFLINVIPRLYNAR